MRSVLELTLSRYFIIIPTLLLIMLSLFLLSTLAPEIFPNYYLFIFLGVLFFIAFSSLDFDIYLAFYKHLYFASIVLLIMPLVIGEVTRGAIRWIPIGSLTIQPSEVVRPFLILFFAVFLVQENINSEKIIKTFGYLLFPVVLILVQPSLGVAVLVVAGFIGALLASSIDKKYILLGVSLFILIAPILWLVLAPYQRNRITTFLDPGKDPYGMGYNTIQSLITVGSGKFSGRGLGKGVQTQLAFLPEKHTDFIFAAVSEELGFVGAIFLLFLFFILFFYIIKIIERANAIVIRIFVTGMFFTLFFQVAVHIGMNMGLFPITGIPLPLVSAGGSSFLATMISFGMLVSAKKSYS